MQDIVREMMERDEAERQTQSLLEDNDDQFGDPRIVIVGTGGASNNTISRLYSIGVEGADTVVINTDKQHLKMIEADTKILVGKFLTQGLGAGGDPSMSECTTEMAQGTIKDVLGDANLVFVTAGIGGGAGTGTAPVVAKIVKEQSATVMGMASILFNVERARTVKAEERLENLRNEAGSIIALDNNRLLDYVPSLPIGKAFSVMDQIIVEAVRGISETITQPSLTNPDYTDTSTIMNQGGAAAVLVGETQNKNKIQGVVNDAMNHPLLDVDYRGASGGLVHITGGPDFTLKEAEGITSNTTERLEAAVNVIWSARIQDEYKGEVRAMAIMTGIQSVQMFGPPTQKQADKPRQSIQFRESQQQHLGSEFDSSERAQTAQSGTWSDDGRDEVEKNNGLDVIR